MTVEQLIRELQALPQHLEVWSMGMELHGYCKDVPALSPTIEPAIGSKPQRVIIDGGCV